jgi:hypothetical protein
MLLIHGDFAATVRFILTFNEIADSIGKILFLLQLKVRKLEEPVIRVNQRVSNN